ncbi:MAG: hypothetical protein Q8N47_02945 [Bryobacterales bacterium]|nr:hypothetical protein [Bryobacterales bacterium]
MVRPLTCDGSWALNRVSFQLPPSVTEFFFSVYNLDVEWFRVDDIVLTYGSGDAPHQTVLYPGVRNVTLSDKAVMVDGAPYLALGFFSVGYDDLQLAANQGANTVSALLMSPATDCFSTRQKNYLDRAYELGLGFMPDSSTTARLRMPEVFPAIMQRFAPHLANIAWMLVDEPDQSAVWWYYIPGPTLAAEYISAKSVTSLPILSNFQRAAWSSTAEVAPYVSAVDFWMAEPYGEDFGSVNYAIDMFNSLRPRPVWLAQNAIDARLLVPKAYWAVIGGATGIIYFDWDAFKSDPAKMAAARQAFGEINGLKSAIFGRNLDSIVTAPAGIGYIARQDRGTVYIAAANPAATLVQGKFAVPGLAAGDQVPVLFENRTITASTGEFYDLFPGVSRHVYAIQSGITVATNPAGLQVVVDGTTLTAPQTFQRTPGSSHTLDVVTPQAARGVRRVFGSWSDSGAKSHSITAPVTATTYTASFTTQYLLTTAASPPAGGTVTATPSSSDGYYNGGQSVQLTANIASGYTFANWSGDLTGTANPGNMVMSAPRSVTANFAAQVVNSPPTVTGVSPAAGVTATQALTFSFTDPNGWQDLGVVNILVNFWLDGRNSCYLAYNRPANTLYLINNAAECGLQQPPNEQDG